MHLTVELEGINQNIYSILRFYAKDSNIPVYGYNGRFKAASFEWEPSHFAVTGDITKPCFRNWTQMARAVETAYTFIRPSFDANLDGVISAILEDLKEEFCPIFLLSDIEVS